MLTVSEDIETIISEYLNEVSQEIKEAATSKGMVASGRTLASLEVVSRPSGGSLLANSSIYFLEHGRGPTSSTPESSGKSLVEIIQQWIDDKGLDLNPYAVAKTIHKHGTKLYRAGGNSGILSVPLKLDRLDEVINEIEGVILARTRSEIMKPLNTIR